MGKYCFYKGCQTGRDADRAKRKRLGLRQLSVFKVPKDMLEQWSKAIGQCLSQSDSVCELHFSDDAIIREDRIQMSDGKLEVIPRIRHSLVKGAVPITAHNQDNVEHSKENVPSNGIPKPSGRCAVVCDCSVTQTPTTFRDVTPKDKGVTTHNWEVLDLEDQSTGFADGLLESRSEISSTCSESVNGVRDVAFGFASDMDVRSPDSVASDDRESNEDSLAQFTIDDVFAHLKGTYLLESWSWITNPREESSVIYVQIDRQTLQIRLYLILHSDLSVTVKTPDGAVTIDLNRIVTSVQSLTELLQEAGDKMVCCGSGFERERRAVNCTGFVRNSDYMISVQSPRCTACRQLRKTVQTRENRRKIKLPIRYARARHASRLHQRNYRRLIKKTRDLKCEIKKAQDQCAAVTDDALTKAISELPLAQQQAVQACLSAAKVKASNQRRYSLDWVYECLLMRIKNGKLYEHLRTRNILPLPCKDTLTRYIKRMGICYGFQKVVFDCLRLKAGRMEMVDKRGALLIDEMSLSDNISFDRQTMTFNGFVDLGEYTPTEQKDERADHALMLMFQPFRGKWVQVLGCFLSKNSVTSRVLHKLILECIRLLDDSGFHVDVVTMDGAQWNRGVWTMFGIRDGQFSCEHPIHSDKRLWMISDFPHLLKCFRNGIVQHEWFDTPHGRVFLRHFLALLRYEAYAKPNLSVAYFLTPAHLDPKGFQKMNVPLAFELFSEKVKVAMEVYKDDPECVDLHDCEPTIKLVEIVNNLIHAMMSRVPANALRPLDTCPHKKAIEDFLRYLREWEALAKQQRTSFPVSSSTVTGLKVTLGGTLELLDYLHKEGHFDYLMTARLNQDALERFFGMMRNSCGSNDHPDPVLLPQVFRLLCTYSLVKPPKGSNVCGTELLETLMETKDSMATRQNPRRDFLEKLDALIETGRSTEPTERSLAALSQRDHQYLETASHSKRDNYSCHDYDVVRTSDLVQAYIAGYIARKCIRLTRCFACINRLKSEDRCERDAVIVKMNHFDGLVCPSEELFKLTKSLEAIVLDIVGKFGIKRSTFHHIVEKVQELDNVTLVGCLDHEHDLTKRVISMYLLMRANFLATSLNKNNDARRLRTKMHRKNAKF